MSAPTSATAATGATPSSEPSAPAANPDDAGSGDEESARTPVTIGLKNGRFTASTAREVHVPSFIAIELDITVADAGPYALTITAGGKQRTATYDKAGKYELLLEGLRPNRVASVALNDQQIKIKADADPGP